MAMGQRPLPGQPVQLTQRLIPGQIPGQIQRMPVPGQPLVNPNLIVQQQQQKVRDRAQPVGKWAHVPPNNTIYVNNINEKLKREELQQSLRHVFGQFGKILDIVCYTKILKAKGQAFICFEKVESATKALQEMQNFMFYNKPIRVSYAKTKSDVIAKKDGTYKPREKKKRRRDKKEKVKSEPAAKKQNTGATCLLVSNLPIETNSNMVQMLFRKYPGFMKVTEPQSGQCQVQFNTGPNASRAMTGMQGFAVFDRKLDIKLASVGPPSIGRFQPQRQ